MVVGSSAWAWTEVSLADTTGCMGSDLLDEAVGDPVPRGAMSVSVRVDATFTLDRATMSPAPAHTARVLVHLAGVELGPLDLEIRFGECGSAPEAVAEKVDYLIRDGLSRRELCELGYEAACPTPPEPRDPTAWLTVGGELAPGSYAWAGDPSDPGDDLGEVLLVPAVSARLGWLRPWRVAGVAQVGLGLEVSVGAPVALDVTQSTSQVHAFGGFLGASVPWEGAGGSWRLGPELGARVGLSCEREVAQPGCAPFPRFEPRLAARRLADRWVVGGTVGAAVPRIGLDPDQPGMWSPERPPVWEPLVRVGVEVGFVAGGKVGAGAGTEPP